jgi:S-adenosylmethionine-diacylglycerol 3-amino-3-carboxypropyl transferase
LPAPAIDRNRDETSKDRGSSRLKAAVHRAEVNSRQRVLDRMFTFAFRHLVYAQIWEDPEVDLRR